MRATLRRYYDAAFAFAHARQNCPGRIEVPEQLYRQAIRNLLGGNIQESTAAGGAGVVDQNIDFSECSQCRVSPVLCLPFARQICRDDKRAPSEFLGDQSRRALEVITASRAQGQTCAFAGKHPCDSETQAGCAARNHYGLAVQPQVHGIALPLYLLQVTGRPATVPIATLRVAAPSSSTAKCALPIR